MTDEWGDYWGGQHWIMDKFMARMSTILRSMPDYVAQMEFAADQLFEFYVAQQRTRDVVQLTGAYGRHLDLHGAGLGRSRLGLADDVYKQTLMVRHAALFFQRITSVLRDILDLLADGTDVEYRIYQYRPLTYQVELRNITLEEGEMWESLLRTAKPDGIRLIVSVATGASTEWFRFDSGPGFDQGRFADAVGGG